MYSPDYSCRKFITRIANESAMEFQKRKQAELAEAEQWYPRAEKVRMRDGFMVVYKGRNVAYFGDR